MPDRPKPRKRKRKRPTEERPAKKQYFDSDGTPVAGCSALAKAGSSRPSLDRSKSLPGPSNRTAEIGEARVGDQNKLGPSSSSNMSILSSNSGSSQDSGYHGGGSQRSLGPPSAPTAEKADEFAKSRRATLATSRPGPLCYFCLSREKDAGITHGSITHQICCYPCAKKLYKMRQPCPMCRRRIEKITKIIVA